jgi:hypothetical protein
MQDELKDAMDIEFTDTEVDVFGDFTEAVQAGKNPDMEEYLARCPGSESKLRPILETALMLDREITQLRRRYPHVDLGKLLELKQKTGVRPK